MIKNILLISLLTITLFPQEKDSLLILKEQYDSFQYSEVIKTANIMLERKENLKEHELIDIYRMKGISHYTLAEDEPASISFKEILKIDSSFNFDPAKVSPKIISFYAGVKEEYRKELLQREPERIIIRDTVFVPQPIPSHSADEFKTSVVRSLALPGWGHIYNNQSAKGWILASAAIASFGSFIFFAVDANEKEKIYLNEKNLDLITTKYDEYNFSYKMKNISLLTFAAVWLYSQVDLLFISSPDDFIQTSVTASSNRAFFNITFSF